MADTVTVLTGTDTKEVSLVDEAANLRRFAITKAQEAQMSEVLAAVLETEVENEKEALEGIEVSEKGQEALTGIARLLHSFKEELSAEAIEAVAKAAGFVLVEEKVEAEEPEAEEVEKALEVEISDEAKEQIEKAKANEEAVRAELAEVKKALDEANSEKLTKEFVEKAATNYAHIPGESEELGAVLKELHSVAPELAEKVETVLAAAEGVIAEGTVMNTQAEATVEVSAGDAESQIEALVQKGIERGLTRAKAYTEAIAANPKLYEELK